MSQKVTEKNSCNRISKSSVRRDTAELFTKSRQFNFIQPSIKIQGLRLKLYVQVRCNYDTGCNRRLYPYMNSYENHKYCGLAGCSFELVGDCRVLILRRFVVSIAIVL